MNKIPTLFVRDRVSHMVIDQVTVGCEWVMEGLGEATRMYDGTCCMVRGGRLWRRAEIRWKPITNALGGQVCHLPLKPLPEGFESCSDVDPVTLKSVGWVPVDASNPQDCWHREAKDRFLQENGCLESLPPQFLPEADGTYELIGPKIQGNPECAVAHSLVKHGSCVLEDELQVWALPRSFATGVVAMAKIKGRDFGIRRGL